MSPTSSLPLPNFQRLRMRFRKEGDLRWISHRDLVRAVERLFRRAGLALRMSQGFHPKPKLSFPSALALGIEGLGEILEVDLVEPVEPQQQRERLNALAPPGLVFTQVTALEPGRGKARVHAIQYRFPVPVERREQVEEAIRHMRAASTLPVQREGGQRQVDIAAALTSVELRGSQVCFGLRATEQASPRPREVLQALGLADLVQQGLFLTRTEVEVVS